jgi:glutamyl/glutaminyl-tRNA synthetase
VKWKTRFNPTVNGPLHVGHLYTILVNYGEAKRSGGTFGIRFDDTQRQWIHKVGKKRIDEFMELMKADLDWLGIDPDWYSVQSEMMEEVEDLLHYEFRYKPAPEWYHCDAGTEAVGFEHPFYPYTDRLTVEKVVMDMLNGVNWLIRGMDLITEECLYQHYCQTLLIHPPRTSYIPRLDFEGGGVISKSEGGYKIHQFREAGIEPDELIINLAHDCLCDCKWSIDDIKDRPKLGKWADEVLR